MATPDIYAARARHTISKYHLKDSHQEILKGLPPLVEMLPMFPKIAEGLPVCIIGAGAAGLYTAMILESLGIKYRLLEASDHVGGRLFTYKAFKDAKPYDYYVSNELHFTFNKSHSRSGCRCHALP